MALKESRPALTGSQVDWMRSRIMVIGRDVGQRAHLARLLTANGYRIEIAESAAHARRVGFGEIALAIVAADGLGPEGRRLIDELRAAIGHVLLVGVRDGNDLSDDASLLTRVAEALQPAGEPEDLQPILQFDGYRLDPAGHCLTDRQGMEIPLTHREFGLLLLFVQRAGRVLSRDQLLRLHSGRNAETFDRSIDMQIVRLRRKIEPDPKRPTLIVTVPGSGYKFVAKVRQAADAAAPPKAVEARPEALPVNAERRYVTALAADLLAAEGTRLPNDPEELWSLVDPWRRYAAAIVARHGGVVTGTRLLEVFGYFGYPVGQEYAAERALHAALAMVRGAPEKDEALPSGLRVRVGVASGLIMVDANGELLGEAPADAASLQHVAQAGQIIVTPSTRRLAGDLFAFRDLGLIAKTDGAGLPSAWQVLGPTAVGSHSEALHTTATTPLIGREEELGMLLRAWQRVKSDAGHLLLVSGEPGIGKSRLLAALEATLVAEPHKRLHCFCSPLREDSVLHPVIACWEKEAGFAHADTPEQRLRKLEALLAPYHLRAEDIALIVATLSIPAGDRYSLPDLPPPQRKERTFAALLHLLERIARDQPVLMLFEDAQWADASSLELLDILVERLSKLPILLAISFRSEFVAPWIGRAGTSLIALSRLNPTDSEMLAAATANHALKPELLQRIVARADGIPLFIEELTKVVLEAFPDQCKKALPLAVPNTLQASLMARLDRVPAAKEAAQIGAVMGHEFSYAMLTATALVSEAKFAEGLNELVSSGLMVRRGTPPDALYTFNHALTRDVAYASLPTRRREIYHHHIATALEQFRDGFARVPDPELVAHHFQEAREFGRAFTYWIAAGDMAEQRGANQEAVGHYRSARQLIEHNDLPTIERSRLPELLMKLGNAQVQIAGYHSEDVVRVYKEARDAALALDRPDEAADAAIRTAPFLFGNCRHREAMDIAYTILKEDQDRLRRETLVHVWVMLSGASWHVGEFERSLSYSEKAVSLDDEVNCTHKAPWAAADPAIVARDYIEMSARMMGQFERSLAISEQSMVIALDRGHLFSIVWASVSRISALRGFGRYAEAVACADRAIDICKKHRFQARIGNVLLHRGPARFDLGDEEGGLEDLQRGIALWRGANGMFMLARNMTILADYQFRARQFEEARISLREAEHLAEATEEKDHLAEIMRLRGRFWQNDGKHRVARCCYEKAIERSSEQRALLFELYATRDLVKLAEERNDAAKERGMLRTIVDRFRSDLDVPVLVECRALLE